jgi:hypothetical protein
MITLDGNAIFGDAVTTVHTPIGSGRLAGNFAGRDASPRIFGGNRGRRWIITGILKGATLSALNEAEATLVSYNDGMSHTLVDDRGRIWPNVVFRGEYVPSATGPRPLAEGGWCLAYRLTLQSDA